MRLRRAPPARWFVPGEIHTRWQFTSLLWLALAGCLAHARFDFPFQVYSILQLFLLECAILSVVSKHRGPDSKLRISS